MMQSPTHSHLPPADPLREDLFLRGAAQSLAPLRPALFTVRAFRDDLLERLSAPQSQALLLPFAVPEPAGEEEIPGHELPLLLLRRASLAALGARLIEVSWPSPAFPRNPAVMTEALALALQTPVAELTTALQRQLQQRPLILLHPALVAEDAFDREEDGPLRYYTSFLPELLGKVRAQHPLHALQPLSWIALTPLRRFLARALAALWPAPPLASRRAVAARDALVLMERLLDPLRQRRALPIHALPILSVPRLDEADLRAPAGAEEPRLEARP